jgi:hypothetical protein
MNAPTPAASPTGHGNASARARRPLAAPPLVSPSVTSRCATPDARPDVEKTFRRLSDPCQTVSGSQPPDTSTFAPLM